jgi:uncharacterized LabA/DUF88 family protein
MEDLYPVVFEETRAMIFVDGENFAMRYGEMLQEARERTGKEPQPALSGGIWYEKNIALWARFLDPHPRGSFRILRRYFYTSVPGDAQERQRIEQWLKDHRFEAPRVFHRDKHRGSKQVDISLATEMLTHAHRKHYDVAILITGDGDYVPLLQAVKAEGARVHVWAFSKGLSSRLRMEADHFVSLDDYFGV